MPTCASMWGQAPLHLCACSLLWVGRVRSSGVCVWPRVCQSEIWGFLLQSEPEQRNQGATETILWFRTCCQGWRRWQLGPSSSLLAEVVVAYPRDWEK